MDKLRTFKGIAQALCFLGLVLLTSVNQVQAQERTGRKLFNDSWQFILDDKPEYSLPVVDTKEWETLSVPHDWSIALPFDSIRGEGCTGYLLGGIGWYRKEFKPVVADNQRCYLLFDGVYNRATIYLNGRKLGFHPYGYSPFYYDITKYLAPTGKPNQLAIRVDHSRYADSRWYTGSGIYRDVELLVVDKLHIPVWGTFIQLDKLTKKQATMKMAISLHNDYTEKKSGTLVTRILDQAGTQVQEVSNSFVIAGNKAVQVMRHSDKEVLAKDTYTIHQEIAIDKPHLWGIDAPYMYKAVTDVVVDGQVLESYTTPFGVRTFKFDAAKGFFLNGQNMKIKGVCLHHDAGAVGAAVPDQVWRRRLMGLKALGVNAIRTAHNPFSRNFMNLCDELGLLVQEEFYDEWDNPKDKRKNMNERKPDYITQGHHEFFQEWAEIDLKAVMLRDRNNPCIFQWSIGNEIEWTYPRNKEATGFWSAKATGGYFWTQPPFKPEEIRQRYNELEAGTYDIGTTAKLLSKWTKELDTSRPVTANCILPSASYETGYADALDVIGFSYRRVMYDYGYEHYPNKPLMGTENVGQWHEWKAIEERPWVSGTFLWTGIEYIGEQNGRWPSRSSYAAIVNIGGFQKPNGVMMETLWNDAPRVGIFTQLLKESKYKLNKAGKLVEKKPGKWAKELWGWRDVRPIWNYEKQDSIVVETYTNAHSVELFLGSRSLGKQLLADNEDHIIKWLVPYKQGQLTAKAYDAKGRKIATDILKTAGSPVSLTCALDKYDQATIKAEKVKPDALHYIVQLHDKKKTVVRNQEREVTFHVEGAEILGVENGCRSTTTPYKQDHVMTYLGRAMVIVRPTGPINSVQVTATMK